MNPNQILIDFYEASRKLVEARNALVEEARSLRDSGSVPEDWSNEDIREMRRVLLLLIGEKSLHLQDEITVRCAIDILKSSEKPGFPT